MPENGESAPNQGETTYQVTSHEVPNELPTNTTAAKEQVVKDVNGPEAEPEQDEFGLPVKKPRRRALTEDGGEDTLDSVKSKENPFKDPEDAIRDSNSRGIPAVAEQDSHPLDQTVDAEEPPVNGAEANSRNEAEEKTKLGNISSNTDSQAPAQPEEKVILHDIADQPRPSTDRNARAPKRDYGYNRATSPNDVQKSTQKVSEFSHQQLAPHDTQDALSDLASPKSDEWQDMPAIAPYDIYDDDGHLVAREAEESDDEAAVYGGLGGAGKGYTKVQIDEDAESATSLDDNTAYLFKDPTTTVIDEDDDVRDPLAQMQATKDLLTEGQRIAYVGVTKVAMEKMTKELESLEKTRGTKKALELSVETMQMWSQKMMLRLYQHMDINQAGMLSFCNRSNPFLTHYFSPMPL